MFSPRSAATARGTTGGSLRLSQWKDLPFEVASALDIWLDGTKWRIGEIMERLGCDSREGAVRIA